LQLDTLRISMRTTLLVPLFSAAALVLARRPDVEMGPFGLAFVVAAVCAGLATLLPYERLFRRGWGMPILYAWSVVNLSLIAIGIWVTGGSSSPLLFLYALTTLFFAVAFTPRVQAVFLALTVTSYSAALGSSQWDPMKLAVLAVLAFLANLMVGQLKHQTAAHREARRESERRWALLAVVSSAARQMSAIEPLEVLRAVVDAVVALGFPTARIYVREEGGYRVVLPPDAPGDTWDGSDSFAFEAFKRALNGGRPVVLGPAADRTLRESLQQLGMSSGVVVPILVSGVPEAILVVGVQEPPGASSQDLEVFQMLAMQAADALENARRFEDLRRSMDRGAELDRMKSDFLSNISHELRTPLTVIAGIGRTLEESSSRLSEDDRRDLLSRLNANAATLDGIIAELLDFGRLEAGRLEVDPLEIDLRRMLTEVAHRLASLFRNHTVQIDVEDGLTARADPLLIERVVENLVANAAKYTPTGSHVRMSAIGDGPNAVVEVEDNGPGIPADEVAHIGERFFRGGDPNTRSTRGTGLGLALVSEILDLHGAYLEVESEVGVGSRFRFRLPRGRAATTKRSIPRHGNVSVSVLGESARPLVLSDGGLPERFETVLAAAKTGLEWPVAALFREFHPRVLRYLRAYLPDRADELAAETWSDIVSALPAFEGDEAAFRRWVFSVARRHVQEAREDGGSDPSRQSKGREDDDVSAEGRAVDAALARIRALGTHQADVLLLRALGDLDVAEVAEIMGDSPDLVRVSALEGLKQLKRGAGIAEVEDLERVQAGMKR
jgi:RNA polymerase sigma factor (sigma-70 family)